MIQIRGGQSGEDLIARVKAEVDVQKLLPEDDVTQDFGRYRRQLCISPEHQEREPSMLVYQDGVYCTACGFKADALDLYALQRPSLSFSERAQELLSGKWEVDPDAVRTEKALRELDPSLGERYHFNLAN